MHEDTEEIATYPPAQQPQTNVRGEYILDLSPLQLAKGDRLQITLEATDFRGNLTTTDIDLGKSARSEPLVLQITDVPGFLAGMVDSDEQSARRLDAIIQRQLGIGD